MIREDQPLPTQDSPSPDSGQPNQEHVTASTEPPPEPPRTYRRLLPDLITVSRAFQTKKRPKDNERT